MKKYLFCNILIVIQLLYAGFLFGQDNNVSQIFVKRANALNVNERIAPDARRFIGNVWLQQEDINMFCDSLYFYPDNNIKAFDNVKMIKGDSIEIYSKYLIHKGNIRQSQFRRNVVLKDKSITLFTDSLNYDIPANVAYYFNGGKIVDSTSTLISESGYYYADEKLLFFFTNVKVENQDYTVYTDTLKYDLNTDIISFEGPTTILTDSTTLYSERGWYNTETKHALIWQNAKYTSSEQIMWGDTIFYDHKLSYGKGYSNIELHSIKDSLIINSDYAYHRER